MSQKNSLSGVTFSRYSLALYELADESNVVNDVEKQALTIVDLISNSEDLKFCIKSPTISKDELENLINSISEKANLNELLNNLKIKKNKVAIEVNGEIVEKNKYPNLILNKGDKVEIVQFIGGG